MKKILLAGTPEFAVPIFEELIKNFDVVAIVSQPDRPSVRGRKITPTPTKELALKYNIKCFQPEKIGDIYDELKSLNYDYLITAAFGQFIPSKILDIANKLNLNIHGSLLPNYRGAAPIQYSVLNGDSETGISIMEMVKQMDAGDVFVQKSVKIDENDTSKDVFEKLQKIATENIVSWINDIDNDKYHRTVQDENCVTFSPKLEKEAGEIKKTMTCDRALRIIKAFNPNPSAYCFINNKRVKVHFAQKDKLKNAPTFDLVDGKLYLSDYSFEGKKRVILK
ncbi:methionyl-tRNA formyltransferase [Mycoplasma sp. ES3157-GEN-MYC]|uniref:Methionyl-tRNA formyltransferase n=1 Tax=Mycoplasma miroungigenitalium TaxID=754515 RepID=A0A6M4J9D8_9MOLU|nr:methionyl-tRNA formyltransferase [Mycoplasma miroungigenitalium]MBU4690455.1 methionyl-tRNA formyltransferase [Mycoplasma miroungigenitalium]MBU4691722.1 methionyl-tRNA formyltransferase [Mycoplasma miroungigenitalium]QJR43550.1 methionyl-tRNA formyltransferase [Mycoplasma miroungigenitalium]